MISCWTPRSWSLPCEAALDVQLRLLIMNRRLFAIMLKITLIYILQQSKIMFVGMCVLCTRASVW
jgi:hypothetical protein